jgi:hypothetical protein
LDHPVVSLYDRSSPAALEASSANSAGMSQTVISPQDAAQPTVEAAITSGTPLWAQMSCPPLVSDDASLANKKFDQQESNPCDFRPKGANDNVDSVVLASATDADTHGTGSPLQIDTETRVQGEQLLEVLQIFK